MALNEDVGLSKNDLGRIIMIAVLFGTIVFYKYGTKKAPKIFSKLKITFLLFFGLALSVVLIGAGASYFAKYIQKHQWVGYVGLVVILLVAVQLIIGGLIDYGVLTINEPFASWF